MVHRQPPFLLDVLVTAAGNKGRRQRAGLRQRKEINVGFYWHYIHLNLPHAYLFKGNEMLNNLRFYLTIKIE